MVQIVWVAGIDRRMTSRQMFGYEASHPHQHVSTAPTTINHHGHRLRIVRLSTLLNPESFT